MLCVACVFIWNKHPQLSFIGKSLQCSSESYRDLLSYIIIVKITMICWKSSWFGRLPTAKEKEHLGSNYSHKNSAENKNPFRVSKCGQYSSNMMQRKSRCHKPYNSLYFLLWIQRKYTDFRDIHTFQSRDPELENAQSLRNVSSRNCEPVVNTNLCMYKS